MCIECRQYPCHPRCPNADEPMVVCRCYICNARIYDGDDMYKIEDMNFCENCITDSKTTAIYEDDDYYD